MTRISLDVLDLEKVVNRVELLLDGGCGGYIVTANTDHLATLGADPEFRSAYQGAFVRTVDGAPVAMALSIRLRRRVPRVTGSDLLPALAALANRNCWRVVVSGGGNGVADAAVRALQLRFPDAEFCSVDAPAIDERSAGGAAADLADRLSAPAPQLVFLGLGAPKQELLAWRYSSTFPRTVVVCCGAAVDFTAGSQVRAPRLFQRFGLEWLYRLVREPRRLAYRYLIRSWLAVPVLIGVRSAE